MSPAAPGGQAWARVRVSSSAIRVWSPLRTCRRIRDWGLSATSEDISTPRFIGPGCSTTHPLSATQVYAALEKGVVTASAWATIGLKGLKWDKFLRHAVEPEFYQTDLGWFMNLKKWNSLDAATQKIVQDTVIAHEIVASANLVKLAAEERATLIKEGMKFHKVPAAAEYTKLAVDSAYNRMMERLKKAGRPTDHVAKLRKLWQEQ